MPDIAAAPRPWRPLHRAARTIGEAGECRPTVLCTVPTGRRESDPSTMLGLIVLVIVAELLAVAVGVALGFLL
jgi:hypothetical protein